ncbi:MAG: hypothetical protein WA847_17645 [Terriglobales bacterium]
MALSAALLIPWVAFFFSMLLSLDWLRLAVWCLSASLLSVLSGIFGARSARFSLIVGGLVVGGLVVIIPVGIL